MLRGAPVLIPRSFSDTFTIHFNPKQLLSLRFYRLHPKVKHVERLCAFLNSTLVTLFLETLGNKNLGQGVLDFFMADFLSMAIPVIDDPALDKAFAAIQRRPIEPVAQEYGVAEGAMGAMRVAPKPDRAALDDIVFNALKLTKGERAAVYAAIVEMVAVRATKASSLKIARDTGKRIDALKATQGIWQGLPAFEDEAE